MRLSVSKYPEGSEKRVTSAAKALSLSDRGTCAAASEGATMTAAAQNNR